MLKKLSFLLSLVLVAALLLPACGDASSSASSQAEPPVSSGSTVSGEAKTLTIVHVNDIHGYVEETETAIGYPKIGGFIDEMKAQDENTLALDAGDTFAGTPNASFDKGESIVDILNTMAFDAFVPGNNDYYLGMEQLEKLTSELNYPSLAGNVVDSAGTDFLPPYLIVEMPNGLSVGLVAATCGFAAGLEFLDPIETTQKWVDEIRGQVDIVVGFVHLGVEDSSGNTSVRLAEEVTGLDLIIDAHSHTELPEGQVVNGILIAQTGEYSNNVGVVDVTWQDGAVTEVAARLVTKEDMADQAEKAETAEALAKLLAASEEYFAEVIGETSVELVGTRDIVRTQETTMGNMYTDAVREALGADVCIAKAGVIGGEIAPGEITKGDVLAISRVSVDYALYEVTGEELLEMLESAVTEYPESSGAFNQLSGVSIVIDPDQAAGERVHSVKVDGKDLDLEATYTVAMSSQAAGDREALETGFGTSEEILEAYIVANSPVAPKIEGRITEGPKA